MRCVVEDGGDKGAGELRKGLEELGERLERLERILGEISRPLAGFQDITSGYLKLLSMYSEHGAISPELIVPELKDPISRAVINVLFQKGDQNVSQIAEGLKRARGKASRRTVREKLLELEGTGLVARGGTSSRPTYSVSDELVRKWSKLLGFVK